MLYNKAYNWKGLSVTREMDLGGERDGGLISEISPVCMFTEFFSNSS